jgi:proteasome lid subunit RPN8/RPN11
MPRTQAPQTDDLPLYVRWSPDRARYGIELRLDLVSEIAAHVDASNRLGYEIGGFLVGTLTNTPVPTLRIEGIEMVSNGSDDDTVFLPEPSRILSLPGSRAAHDEGGGIVGFFRTHVRVGPMRPSLADRSILAHEFDSKPYVVLLVDAQAPHTAAFFVAQDGQLPEQPSVRDFEFDENAFKALPEVPAGVPEARPVEADVRAADTRNLGLYARLAALILIAIGACALMWTFAHQPKRPQWFDAGKQLHLAITPDDKLLRISWNHSAKDLNQATGAMLVITDTGGRSEVQLGMDDLRLGAVEYQANGGEVNAQMILNTQAGPVNAASARWSAR